MIKNYLLALGALLSFSALSAQPRSDAGQSSPADTATAYRATNDPVSIAVQYLDSIVVTATRTPVELKNTPVITRVITRGEIRRKAYPSVQQVLENEIAGIEFHQAGYGTSMSFQGLDARYVLVLVDGERMAGELSGNVDLSKIDLFDVERIEVVKGASSVLYGSNAMGATINIITKTPEKGLTIGATYRYGTPYQDNFEGKGNDYTQHLDLPNNNFAMNVGYNSGRFISSTSLSYLSSDAYLYKSREQEKRHYDTATVFNNRMQPRMVIDTTIMAPLDTVGLGISGWKSLSASQRLDYILNDRFRFSATGSLYDQRRYDFAESIASGGSDDDPWSYEHYHGYTARLTMEHTPNDKNKVYLSYYTDYNKRDDVTDGDATSKQRHRYTIPRLLWSLDAGSHRLTTGAEYINERLNYDLSTGGYDSLETLNTGSLFVQDEYRLSHHWSFVAGVRGDYSDKFGWGFAPKLAVKYNAGRFIFRGNYSYGFRNPSLKELYMSYYQPQMGRTITGNPDLNPEHNNYFSLSAEYNYGGWFNTSLTAYTSRFDDKIDVTSQPGNVLLYNNIKNSTYSGIEWTGRVKLFEGMYFKGNYNYVHTEDDATEGSQYIYVSPHTALAMLDYRSDAGRKSVWGASVGARYIGRKEYADRMPIFRKLPTGALMPEVVGDYTAVHPGYVVCNASVNYAWSSQLMLTVGCDNLFDYRPDVVNFNAGIAPPRNAFARLTVNFHK